MNDQSTESLHSVQATAPVSSDSGDFFSDSSCGEPLASQRIVLDFTPDDAIDTDFVQRKCVAFWDFISQHPDLQNLSTSPDYNVFGNSSSTPSSSYIPERIYTGITEDDKQKTAVSMLELVEEKGLIDRAFEMKLPRSYCSLYIPEYSRDDSIARTQEKVFSGDEKRRNKKHETLKKMCVKLEEWDSAHPRCKPLCKSRRREWKGDVQNTSAELLLERKPKAECFHRWPTKVYPNSPCPLFATTRRVTVKERGYIPQPEVVRICQAPVDDTVDTTYLKLAELAKNLAKLALVKKTSFPKFPVHRITEGILKAAPVPTQISISLESCRFQSAWDAVKARCAFCDCNGCCPCSHSGYDLSDETDTTIQSEMQKFDHRVKLDCQDMKIMYH
ncbi:unnamed protein product [Leptosia nina]|uniref:Uncharacterized protein n=1 Tax=Leptosia nina TaxID=320188 RepID=A0AAV1JC13_9NEOP